MYIVIRSTNIERLEAEVNTLLSKNWELVGGVSSTGSMMLQAMVSPKEPDTKKAPTKRGPNRKP